MKRCSISTTIVVVATILTCTVATAETVETVETKTEKTKYLYEPAKGGLDGLSLSFVKGLATKGRVKVLGDSESASVDQDFGVAVGYSKVSTGNLGFIGKLTHQSYEGNDGSSTKLDGNLAFGLNDRVYLFGGLNYTQLEEDSSLDWDPGLGLQVGTGILLTDQFGVEISYAQINNSASFLGTDVDISLSGLELALVAHF